MASRDLRFFVFTHDMARNWQLSPIGMLRPFAGELPFQNAV
jgi:hypothetical protein